MPAELADILNDDQFWDDLSEFSENMEESREALLRLQGDITNLADAYYVFTQLETHYRKLAEDTGDERWTEAINSLTTRWNLQVCDAHCAAYALSPRFLFCDFPVETFQATETYLKKVSGEENWLRLAPIFRKFRNRSGVFSSDIFRISPKATAKDDMEAWMMLTGDSRYSDFAHLALKMLRIPSGIAGIERTFSAVRRIHTWDRASLGASTVDKLIYIYVNTRFLEAFE